MIGTIRETERTRFVGVFRLFVGDVRVDTGRQRREREREKEREEEYRSSGKVDDAMANGLVDVSRWMHF